MIVLVMKSMFLITYMRISATECMDSIKDYSHGLQAMKTYPDAACAWRATSVLICPVNMMHEKVDKCLTELLTHQNTTSYHDYTYASGNSDAKLSLGLAELSTGSSRLQKSSFLSHILY